MEVSVDGEPVRPMRCIDSTARAENRIDPLACDPEEAPQGLPIAHRHKCQASGPRREATLPGAQRRPNENGTDW